jgi:hypothetical protein
MIRRYKLIIPRTTGFLDIRPRAIGMARGREITSVRKNTSREIPAPLNIKPINLSIAAIFR